jgi:eukaryotic-like serine/threonine-protein kinase
MEDRLEGRYRLLSVVGHGGMGTVWRACDELLERDVAIKEVPGQVVAEARATARLDHPGVVTVHDVLASGDRTWIVMELIRGSSLQQVIDRDGPLAPRRVAEIGCQVLSVLCAVHALGMLHRDVKPSNVLLSADGRVVLTDFGLAGLQGEKTGLEGSPAYISPEQARGDEVTEASDLWALGALLYTAVEGRSPFGRSEALASLLAVLIDEYRPPRQAGPLRQVIDGLLRKDVGSRLGAEDAAELLDRVRFELPRRRPRAGATATVAALVAIVIMGGAWSARWSSVGSGETVLLRPTGATAGTITYREDAGYAIDIPAGWTRAVKADGIYWQDPHMNRFLRISRVTGDPLAALQAAKKRSPGLHSIRLEASDGGAEWEYTSAGMHSLETRADGYDLLVVAPDARWTPHYRDFDAILRTFRS